MRVGLGKSDRGVTPKWAYFSNLYSTAGDELGLQGVFFKHLPCSIAKLFGVMVKL